MNIEFLPSQVDPTEVKLQFVDSPDVKDLIAKLPANHEATMRLVRLFKGFIVLRIFIHFYDMKLASLGTHLKGPVKPEPNC